MKNALASEWFLLKKCRIAYAIATVWLACMMLFGFGIPYIVFLTLESSAETQPLAEMLIPASVHQTALGSYPLYGGAIMLILGAVIGGSEYGWGTWRIRLTQGPSRTQVIIAKAAIAATASSIIAILAHVVAIGMSQLIAAIEGFPKTMPPFGILVQSLLAAMLISAAWTVSGFALGILCRSTALALTIGLLWTLAFENVISGLTMMYSSLAPIQKVLLGPASGSLAAAFGVKGIQEGGAMGVVDAMSGPTAICVLSLYIAISAVLAITLMNRRDIN